jgi:carbon storage regulator
MLIVARRKGQRVLLGPDIEVVVTEIGRNMVKLGIVAPGSCTILRGEVHDAIVEANRGAALSALEPSESCPPRTSPASSEPGAP